MDSTILILFASVLVVGVTLLLFIGFGKRGPKQLSQQEYREQWMAIEQSLKNDSDVLQLAIIKADKLLDQALKQLSYKGETMGERLKSAGKNLGNVDAAWAAHKLRNRIAHEQNVNITPQLAKKALASFKQALRSLGAL